LPGGRRRAVSPDGSRWIPCKGNYLFNARALSLVFRGKFMERMKKACQRQDLKLAETIQPVESPAV
jgi:hypothetical protein